MPRIPSRFDYQPPRATMNKWLSCRQDETLLIGTFEMPKLFSDEGSSSDSIWFMVAVLGEVIGLGITIIGGMRSGGQIFAFATLTVIMFILCDFFFAIKLHRNVGSKCKLKSLIILNAPPAVTAALKLKLKKGKFLDLIFQLGIMLIAIIKVIGIVLLGVFSEIILYLPFAIIYMIVAYVHLKHTGYFFAEQSTQRQINKGHKEWAESIDESVDSATIIHEAAENKANFKLKDKLQHLPKNHLGHNLESSKDDNKYELRTKGILLDEDIIALISQQDHQNQAKLFREFRQFQITHFL